MPQAQITVNGTPGSNLDLPINTDVLLNNAGTGGELTYNWTILDQPPGAADGLTSTTVQDPTLTPRKENTYLIRLVVNQGLASEVSDQVVIVVQDLKTRTRIPAALEKDEAGATGWAKPNGVDTLLALAQRRAADPGVMVGEATASLAPGAVVRFPGVATLKSGLPGQETVPTVSPALAAESAEVDHVLGCVIGAVDGGTISSGTLVVVRLFGLVEGLDLGSPAVGDPVYVSDTGTIATTAGTALRRVGVVVANGAGATDAVYFTGFDASGGSTDCCAELGAFEPESYEPTDATPVGQLEGIDRKLGELGSGAVEATGVLEQATGNETGYKYALTVDKAAGNYTAMEVDVVETSAPGSENKILDLRTGGVSRVSAAPDGVLTVAGLVSPAALVRAGASGLRIADPTDPTKVTNWDVSAVGAGQTRTIAMPNANVDLAGLLHSGISGEIAALTEKTTLAGADKILLENSAAGDAKVYATLTSVAAFVGGGAQSPVIFDADVSDSFEISDSAITGGVHDRTFRLIGDYYYHCQLVIRAAAPGSVTFLEVVGYVYVSIVPGPSPVTTLTFGVPSGGFFSPSGEVLPGNGLPRGLGIVWGPSGSPQSVTIYGAD
ncbi:MAG: hypothetical protein KF729_38730 [Sandaracinaceae bacterium]|nr:hypothetical protein [Sandaracinaceae bacterium]